MKFCKKCGNQLADHASFCPKCGSMVEKEAPAPQPAAPIYQQAAAQDVPSFAQPAPQPVYAQTPVYASEAPVYVTKKVKPANPEKVANIFGFIYKIVTIIALTWIALSIAFARVNVDVNYSGSYYGYSFYAYGWIYFDYLCGWFALSFASVSFGLAIATMIISLVKRLGMKQIFDCIVKIFGAAVIVFLAIIFMVV